MEEAYASEEKAGRLIGVALVVFHLMWITGILLGFEKLTSALVALPVWIVLMGFSVAYHLRGRALIGQSR